jgi:two-component system NtrC family response regulator
LPDGSKHSRIDEHDVTEHPKAHTRSVARILVIDDESTIRSGCRLVLEDQGWSVDCSATGRDGLQAIRRGAVDIVLLDLKLPDMDGMQILRTVGQETPAVRVIVMTGFSTVRNAVEAMKLGAFDYLPKPFDDDELVRAVGRAAKMKRLMEVNRALRERLVDRAGFDSIVGEHPKMLETFEQVTRVAPMDTTVLITGESGTGKELFARAIHAHSHRSANQFVAVDCSSLAPNLLESELFGHVEGAFTGAVHAKKGVFEIADDGSLFLDEVANLSPEIQAKLLRVLESLEYKPVGASQSRQTTARVIAATNQDLRVLTEEGTFRQDLYYRLNVMPIHIPPLRERKEDIARLAYHFLHHLCTKTGKRIEGFSDDALEALEDYDWPGNVRQLRNVVERLVILSDQEVLDPLFVLNNMQENGSTGQHSVPENVEELNAVKKRLLRETFGQVQKAFLIHALKASHGNITHAAERVGMKRSNFSALMKKHNVSAKTFQD